jgi:tetratricopeptide (TPR) repeat protein
MGNLGTQHLRQGRVEQAFLHYESALSIQREAGNRRAEGAVLNNLGVLHKEQGRTEEARRHYRSALTIQREVGDRAAEGLVLGNLGAVHKDQGRPDEARRHYESALDILREVGDRRSEGLVLGNLGDLVYANDDLPRAARFLEDAISISDEIFPAAAGAFRGTLALICARRGDFTEARELLARGEEQVRDVFAVELAKLLCKRTIIERLGGDSATAAIALAEAVSIARDLNADGDSEVGELLAEARAALG